MKVGCLFFVERGALMRVPGGRRARKKECRRNWRPKKRVLVVLEGPGPSGFLRERTVYVREFKKKGRRWLVNPLLLSEASPLEALAVSSA